MQRLYFSMDRHLYIVTHTARKERSRCSRKLLLAFFFLLPLTYCKSILNHSLSVLSLQYQTVVLLASLSESSLPWWEMIALNSLCACHPFCWKGGQKGKPAPSSTTSSSHSSLYKGLKRNWVKLNIIDNWLWDHGTLCPFCTCIWS